MKSFVIQIKLESIFQPSLIQMSIDYLVITTSKASIAQLKKLCSRYTSCSLHLSDKEEFVIGDVFFKSSFICSIAGPLDLESADIGDVVPTAKCAKYIYEVGAPSCLDAESEEIVIRLCSSIAQSGNGVAIDSVSGKVFYSARVFEIDDSIETERKMEKIDLLTISFIIRPEDYIGIAPKLLDLLSSQFPFAFPNAIDSLQNTKRRKMTRESEYIELWESESSIETGGNITWYGDSPFLNGNFVFAQKGPLSEDIPSKYSKRHYLDLNFNGTLFYEFSDNASYIVQNLISQITTLFNTVYASAYVQRNYAIGKNTYWFLSNESESLRIDPGYWAGIPNFPSWMTWFGPEYYSIVSDTLSNYKDQVSDLNQGLLLKMGAYPLNRDELSSIYPKFPKEYMVPATKLPKFD